MPDHEILEPFAASAIPHVGTYRRVLPVSLERLYENALDWEHLPHLHAGSFASLTCEAAGPWGWRCAVTDTQRRPSRIELRLDRRCRRWITRTLEGANPGSEIWTHAFPLGERRVDIVVDFFVPGIAAAQRSRVGRAFARLYETLYDEDVAMMQERQRQLDRRIDRARDHERSLDLGPRSALSLPRDIRVGGREFVLTELEGELVAFPRQCPHQLGPLTADALQDGVLTCPWHGYRFDPRSGDNLSGGGCRLSHLPQIEVDASGCVRVHATH